jgi:hypothetical protein
MTKNTVESATPLNEYLAKIPYFSVLAPDERAGLAACLGPYDDVA